MTTQITGDPLVVARVQLENGEFRFTVPRIERCPQHTEFYVDVGRSVKNSGIDGNDPQLTEFGDHLVQQLAKPRVHLCWSDLTSNETIVIMLANDYVEPYTLRLKGLPVAVAEVIQAVINVYR